MKIRFISVSEFIEFMLQSITSMAAKWPWVKRDEISLMMKSGWHISLLFLRH